MFLALALVAIVAVVSASATTAMAHPGVSYPTRCSNCHSGAGTNPTATLVSNNGTTAVYNVSGGALEWAVFNGTTRLAGQTGSTGQFSVAVGGTYTLYAVDGYPGPMGVTTVSPVAPSAATFTISASAGPNGSISPGSTTVDQGSSQAFTMLANSGFHVADVLVDGVSVGAVGTFTFFNVTDNHTIAVTFAMDVVVLHTITPTAGPNGSISPATAMDYVAGSNVPFIIAADPGFHIADVLVDAVSVGAVGSYTFPNLQADHSISVTFDANVAGMFNITPSAGANGSISPGDVQSVVSGSDVAFAISPEPGYHIESVTVDGVVIPTVGLYTFTNVQADHTIMATFSNDPDVAAPTHLTLHVNHSSVRRNHSVRLSSVLSNTLPALFFGTQIRYEMRRPGSSRWVLVQKVLVGVTGASRTRLIKLTRRGTYSFRVRFLGTDDFRASTSRTVRVRVR